MSWDTVTYDFIYWYNEKNYNQSQIDYPQNNSSMFSIFEHPDEFKKYINESYDCGDVAIFSKSVSEILQMDIENGVLVDNDNSNNEENVQIANTEINNEIQSEDEGVAIIPEADYNTSDVENDDSLVIPPNDADVNMSTSQKSEKNSDDNDSLDLMLKDMVEEDVVKSAFDINQDGIIDDEEFKLFKDVVKNQKTNSGEITTDDVFDIAQKVIDGEIALPDNQVSEEPDIDVEEIDTPEVNEAPSSGNASSSSGPSSSGGGGSYSPSYSSDVEKVQEKSLDYMSAEELNNELNSVKDTLKDNQDALTDIFNDEDPSIKGYKEAQDKAYETFQENLKVVDKEMADKLEKYKQDVDTKEQEVLKQEQEIAIQENNVSQAKNNLDKAISTRDTLQSISDELDGVDVSALSPEEQSELQTKKQQVAEKLAAAEDAVDEAQEKLDETENKLDELKEVKTEKEEALDKANEQMSLYEGKIVEKHAELDKNRTDYDIAKNQYYSQKNIAITSAKQAINDSQVYLNKIECALTNIDNKQMKKDYGLTSPGEDIVDFALQFVGKDKYEMCKILKDKGYPFDMEAWCAEFVSFCSGQVLGEENLPEWYTTLNRKFCPSIMDHGRRDKDGIDHSLPDIRDAEPGDMVMIGEGGTGRDHAAIFLEWCDEEHNKYRTVERSGDIVKICERQVSWNEIGAIFRLY